MVSKTVSILPGSYAICRLPADRPIPAWALGGTLFSVTRTADELSIVCLQARVPHDIIAERDWRAIQVAGPLDFSLTGILAGLSGALAEAGISIFAVSTYDTDYLFVRAANLERARAALQNHGWMISDDNTPL